MNLQSARLSEMPMQTWRHWRYWMSPTIGVSGFFWWFLHELKEQPCGDMIKQTTSPIANSAFCHLGRRILPALVGNWRPGAHGITTVGKLHRIFCWETGALCRYLCKEMPKKNVSELVSITNLLRQTSLEFGNCKMLVLSMNVSR